MIRDGASGNPQPEGRALARDPHDPLAMLEQLNATYRARKASLPDATNQADPIVNKSAAAGERDERPVPAIESRSAADGKRHPNPFDPLSLQAAIPSEQS